METTSPPTVARAAARPQPQADAAYPAKTITPPDKSVVAMAPARPVRWPPAGQRGYTYTVLSTFRYYDSGEDEPVSVRKYLYSVEVPTSRP